MASHVDEHERTMVFCEIALGQIKALRQAATPRNYEIWYAYATGYHPSLNQKINETLQQNGSLSQADLELIYEACLSRTPLTDKIDKVGSQVMGEIEQVMAMIEAAAGSASSYTNSLADMTEKLGNSVDRDGLRSIVESLVQTTKEMEASNQKLEERLNASKREIDQLQVNLEAVRTESLTDPLTQLANRKFFDMTLEQAIADARDKNEPLSLLMADIDHFKTFNDSFGHLTGDQVLRLVAMSVKQNVKGLDTTARYGGEEFAIVLPNTVLRSAMTVADHIRRAVMTKELMKRSSGEHLGRVDPVEPAQQRDLREPGLGDAVRGRLGEDPLIRDLGSLQVAVDQCLVGCGEARILRHLERRVDAARLHDRIDPLAQLRLRDNAVEGVHRSAASHRVHGGNALHAERRGDPRVGVDVDLRQHPRAAALAGELFEDRRELLARLAPVGPEIDDDGRLHRPFHHIGLERRLSDRDDHRVRAERRRTIGRSCRW